MRFTVLIVVLIFTACGPEPLEIVDSFTYRGITLQSEVRFNYEAYPGAPADAPPFEGNTLRVYRVKEDIDRIISNFEKFDILSADQFENRFKEMPIYVRNVRKLDGTLQGKHFHGAGMEWIELPRGGGALGHELMHVIGNSNHDSNQMWDNSQYQAVDDDFIQWSGGWYIIVVPSN